MPGPTCARCARLSNPVGCQSHIKRALISSILSIPGSNKVNLCLNRISFLLSLSTPECNIINRL
jgi:hypothetical protein